MKILLRLILVLASLTIMASMPTASAVQAATQVNNYETPCHHRERVARDIPAYSVHGGGLLAYVHRHLDEGVPDAELADFWQALKTCDRTQPVPRWAWSEMVLTNVEYLG
jgi:poly(3-hydroxybutyrate) depolymerase